MPTTMEEEETWSADKILAVEYDDKLFHLLFENRDLLLQTTNAEGNLLNITIQERMYVPLDTGFHQGVKFRYFLNRSVLFLQLPDFLGAPGFAIDLDEAHYSNSNIHTALPRNVFDMIAEEMNPWDRRTVDCKDNRWCKCSYRHMASLQYAKVEKLEETLRQRDQYSRNLPRNQLATVRENSMTDFTIICNDSVEIKVHKAVLSTFWPFFQVMMENACKETEEAVMKLNYDAEVVDMAIRDIYGQSANELNFHQAVQLLGFAGVYGFPELSRLAFDKISAEESSIDLVDSVAGWKSARLGSHSEAKSLFAARVVALAESEESEKDRFDGIDRNELLELFLDSGRAKKRKLAEV